LFSADMRLKAVRLGSSEVGISYPQVLDPWFEGFPELGEKGVRPRKRVRLVEQPQQGRFDVVTGGGGAVSDLALGEALAIFWERVSFLLVDDLCDAMALHASALCKDDCFLLLPGQTGCGKTRLALWYRTQGFELGTDEIVALGGNDAGEPMLVSALARPAFLKAGADLRTFLRPAEEPVAEHSSYGLMVRFAGTAQWLQRPIGRGLIVFPCFKAASPMQLTRLTAGEAALGLIGSCLNARNLPRGGLSLAALLARRLPAISLTYGETSALEGALDVLTRQLLAKPITADDVAALCEAFTARARMHSSPPSSTIAPDRPQAPRLAMPAATTDRFPRRLTIGMATYDDYDGVYFTVQSIRISNPELDGALEIVVIDNNPGGPCSQALSRLGSWIDGYRYVPRGEWSGTAMRNAVFEEASSPFVLCVDSHVFIVPGALSQLIAHFEANPDTADLLQGPMMYDDLRKAVTHMEPQWRDGMYGVWETDPRGADPTASSFDIPMHGLGLFACRRTAWPGFHPAFRGFGGEEGYIHEKIRRRGGRTLCLPFLRWLHRFNRPLGLSYANRWEDRIRNYFIGFHELGLDTAEMESHFAELIGQGTSDRIFTRIKRELGIPDTPLDNP
jgi:hypothetical protein